MRIFRALKSDTGRFTNVPEGLEGFRVCISGEFLEAFQGTTGNFRWSQVYFVGLMVFQGFSRRFRGVSGVAQEHPEIHLKRILNPLKQL